MKKILITGGTGLLGNYLIASGSNYSINAVYKGSYFIENKVNLVYSNCDILLGNFEELVLENFNPDVIIHTASIGNVDYCEKNPEEARLVHISATQKMLDLAKKYKAHFIFTSSNAVYDGKNHPFSEEDPINPLSIYGKLKAEAEELIKNSNLKWTIVRPIIMYGWNIPQERANPVTWIISKLKKQEKIFLVNDVYENPLYSGFIADIIWQIVEKEIYGVFNIAGKDSVNRYEWARVVAKVFNLDSALITPVTSDYFPSIIERPKNTTFNVAKMENIFNCKALGIVEGLELMKKEKYI
ncbi:NAD(P)-dependent oxidoreductase [Candidatus Lokiarchaeum ossiferum]|uniref:NAD(P)-dependent oxidoreductase n=1 Tax=Candidatus Lokiarchaeum ossiferum TaxID=2951803 RepID=UPI00352C7FDA